MSHAKAVFGDILVIFATLLAGGMTGWFLRAGLRSGLIETRYGSYNRAQRPGRFWVFVGVYATGLLICTGALIFALFDLFLGFRAS